jgi:hypothetical protein
MSSATIMTFGTASPDAVVTIEAMTRKLYTTEDVETRSGTGGRTRRFIITSDSLDRDMEVVLPRGLLTDEYMRNPQFLWAHKYDMPPSCPRGLCAAPDQEGDTGRLQRLVRRDVAL